MKVINLGETMYPWVLIVRHWGKWYYIDRDGTWIKMKGVGNVGK